MVLQILFITILIEKHNQNTRKPQKSKDEQIQLTEIGPVMADFMANGWQEEHGDLHCLDTDCWETGH